MTRYTARRGLNGFGRRRLFLNAPLLLCCLLLAACAAPRQPAAPAAEQAAAPAVVVPPPIALTLPAPVPGEPPRRAESRDAVGKTAAEMRVLFGEPGLLRREPPSEVWQYTAQSVGQSGGCVLIFVLYPENGADGSVLRVHHGQSLPRRRGSPVGDADCVEALLKVPPVSVTAKPSS
ncbi:hypothetical protein [Ferrovibrio sp.]|uniref:hypothetical protein n=1 Tax=Ferrovibrio sp. TaxID=1917215 RepID=UPI0035AE48EC